jgi:hypothetical protein
MKNVTIIVLVILLLLLVAIPLGMSMAMGTCSSSHSSMCPAGLGMCVAIISVLAFAAMLLLQTLRPADDIAPPLLVLRSIERPPPLA